MTKIFTRTSAPFIALAIGFAALTLFPWSALAADAAFDPETLTTEKAKPTIEGSAEDVRSIRVLIENEEGKRVFRSKSIRVKNDEWKARVSKSLKDGTYEISILGARNKVLESDTLTIGEPAGGTVVASMIPFLTGGTAAPYNSVPVAYVRVANPSTASTTVTSITLMQNGSASASALSGFSTNDEKGGSRAMISTNAKSFSKNLVSIPFNAVIAPGAVAIYTIKANLAGTSGNEAGKQLQFNVASIETNGRVGGTFPIRGTTWTLTR